MDPILVCELGDLRRRVAELERLVASSAIADINTALGALTAAQAANRVLAGPATGANAAPTFRALVTADIPA